YWLNFAFMENLLQQVNNLKEEMSGFSSDDKNPSEVFRIKFLGSNGSVKALMGEMKNVPVESKREMGKVLNDLKLFAENKFEELKSNAAAGASHEFPEADLSLPGDVFS